MRQPAGFVSILSPLGSQGEREALMKRSPWLMVYCARHQLQASHLISSFRILWVKTAAVCLSLQLLGILKAESAMHFL